ncbi:MAG: hypothetical protein GY679_02065 [Mycoplasma sp.]|nr:hypothetical protein [Mycoplasma sp.]
MKLLLVSDLHLRSDIPKCRVDDFLGIQRQTTNYIFDTADNYDCVVIAGDIFHRAVENNCQRVMNELLENVLKKDTLMIAGNHDLLNHNREEKIKTNYGIIDNVNNGNKKKELIEKLYKNNVSIKLFDFGEEIKNIIDKKALNIAVIHQYCNKPETPAMFDNVDADYFFDNFEYDVFVVGDNHESFVVERDGRLLINPGCTTRQSRDLKSYKPSMMSLNTETLGYEHIDLPDNDLDAVNNESIKEVKKELSIDYKSYVDELSNEKELTLDFEENIEKIIKNKDIAGKTLDYIRDVFKRCKDGK